MTKKLIYADHAATTPLSDVAWEAMLPFLREDFGSPSSLYEGGSGHFEKQRIRISCLECSYKC